MKNRSLLTLAPFALCLVLFCTGEALSNSATNPAGSSAPKISPSPREVYLKFTSILMSPTSKMEDIKPYQSKRVQAEMLKTPFADKAVEIIRMMAPKDASIVSEQINGNTATIKLKTPDKMEKNPFTDKPAKSVTTGEIKMVPGKSMKKNGAPK